MSILRRLLSILGAGGGAKPHIPQAKPLLLPPKLVWSAVRFTASTAPYTSERSYFGGDPNLTDDERWPEHNGRRLDFLFRLDCSDLDGLETNIDLPAQGALLFFYDVQDQPWGEASDAGGWKVIYQPQDSTKVLDGVASPGLLPTAAARFEQIETYPDPSSPWVEAAGLSEEQIDDLVESEAYNEAGQVGGHPSIIQNAMEVDCELSSRGISPNSKAYASPEGVAAAAVARDWRLLLQYPSDKRLGTVLADYGSLYYWIKAEDLARRDFSRVWLQMQTS